MSSKPPSKATLRLYCQGIGDCHLLKFTKQDGSDFWMLIDCGIHTSIANGQHTIDRIVEDIARVTQRLDVVVATHEHWDHLSGFLTAKEKFENISVGEVWMAWTEDPHDAQAKILDKFKDQALTALGAANQHLADAAALNLLDGHLQAVHCGLDSLRGFNFGVQGERVRTARDALVALAHNKVKYLEPTDAPFTLPGLPNLRIYVLGPPRDAKLLGIREAASEMYGLEASGGCSLSAALNGAFATRRGAPWQDEAAATNPAEDAGAPFDNCVGTELSRVLEAIDARASLGKHEEVTLTHRRGQTAAELSANAPDPGITSFVHKYYVGQSISPRPAHSSHESGANAPSMRDPSWRRIDHDWLGVSADLAMQLDSRTNNTSLVLAFEFVDTKRVMLFTADAQAGSWLSWQKVEWQVGRTKVAGPELLGHTVFLKVGHHGSPNATLKEKGLELMKSHDLAAFIPTNEADAHKVHWGKMPFPEICTALEERTAGRVIRADDAWIATPNAAPHFRPPSGSIMGLRHQPGLWVEFDVG